MITRFLLWLLPIYMKDTIYGNHMYYLNITRRINKYIVTYRNREWNDNICLTCNKSLIVALYKTFKLCEHYRNELGYELYYNY